MTIYDDDYLHVNNCDGNVYYLIFTYNKSGFG